MIQLTDHLIGKNVLPTLEVIPEPSEATFLSRKWFCETLGSGVGSIVPFLTIEELTGLAGQTKPFQMIRAGSDNIPIAKSVLGLKNFNFDTLHLAKMTLDGSAYGALFVPAQDQDHFWQQRVANSVGVAAVFGTQFAVAHGVLNGLEKTGLGHMHFQPGSELNSKTIGARLGSNLIGGSAAGFVGLETMSGLYGYGPADGNQVKDTVARFAVTGLAIDTFHIGQEGWHHHMDNKQKAKAQAETLAPDEKAPNINQSPPPKVE
jgi:hypothetical protein